MSSQCLCQKAHDISNCGGLSSKACSPYGTVVQQLLADQRAAEERDEEAVALLLELVAVAEQEQSSADSPAASIARWAVRQGHHQSLQAPLGLDSRIMDDGIQIRMK